jgi:hypothetical protein
MSSITRDWDICGGINHVEKTVVEHDGIFARKGKLVLVY